jgi:hypothetical protein
LRGTASIKYTVAGPPSVTIKAPSKGARFAVGQRVHARYSCADGPSGPGIASCHGTVADGAAVPTRRPGRYTLSVTARSRDGQHITRTVSYVALKKAQPHLRIARLPARPLQPGCGVEKTVARKDRSVHAEGARASTAAATCSKIVLGVVGRITSRAEGVVVVRVTVALNGRASIQRTHIRIHDGHFHGQLVIPGIDQDPLPPLYRVRVSYPGDTDVVAGAVIALLRLEVEPRGSY